MRAREPDKDGFVERDGVRIHYEVFGEGDPPILLLPPFSLIHSRVWKGQVPYLARHFTVIAYDPRGNGRSDRPATVEAYAETEFVADAVAVLDETDVGPAVLVGFAVGARHALMTAAAHPDRALGVVAIAPTMPWRPPGVMETFNEVLDTNEGWAKFNAAYWLKDYRGFVEWYAGLAASDPHSSKLIEDMVTWSQETTPETVTLAARGPGKPDEAGADAICRAVRCPTLVIRGGDDVILPARTCAAVAEGTAGTLVTVDGAGHTVAFRHPVRTYRLISGFASAIRGSRPAAPPATPARGRRKRVLFVCSPIGLGHARRDAAIAAELRALRPDLEIEWLAQSPVTEVLAQRGERIHPASRWLAGEAAHIESEAGEHDLHAFQAIRRMDEILVANFGVFDDVVSTDNPDLVVADEGWDIDHFLHENPELKRSPFAWLTDFVGWLPMPDGGPAEAALTADNNAEMVEHVSRYPRLRDRSIFVGDADDLVTAPLGPGLPTVRDWTERHFDFAGYITGFEPPPDREELRARLGYGPDERICLVTVGGTGVGAHLLRRVAAAYPQIARRVPGARMVVVAGPRIDPASLDVPAGVEVRGWVPDLHLALAACDIAVVQGGLTTTMELVAARRPFLYFPLARHFEQQFHVPHRLDRYRAGRRMDYATATPDVIAAAVAEEIVRPVDYRVVATDGAWRAATMLADLI